jgi:hypothetical protein
MAWYGDVQFKQCAVSELLVAENGSVINNDKWLKMYITAVDKKHC